MVHSIHFNLLAMLALCLQFVTESFFHLQVMSELRNWADLPDGLLHTISSLLGSFRGLLAFAATCHPWRSAFSSHPSKSTLYTLFPPLLLQPNVPFCSPRPLPNVATGIDVLQQHLMLVLMFHLRYCLLINTLGSTIVLPSQLL